MTPGAFHHLTGVLRVLEHAREQFPFIPGSRNLSLCLFRRGCLAAAFDPSIHRPAHGVDLDLEFEREVLDIHFPFEFVRDMSDGIGDLPGKGEAFVR